MSPRLIGAYEPVSKIRLSWLGLLVLACGLTGAVAVKWVGELYVGELALPIVALICVFASLGGRSTNLSILAVPRGRALFVAFLVSLLITLVGYVISDIVRITRPDQYLRGWGRVLFVTLDFLSLAVIVAKDRRLLWWFSLGIGAGGVLYLWVVKQAPLSQWKSGYAEPALVFLMAVCAFLPFRLTSVALVGFALFSITHDYRSLAALSLICSGYLWVRARRPGIPLAGFGPMFKLLIAGGAVLTAISYGLSTFSDEETLTRRSDSNAGRAAGIEVGIIAVARSPIIGYGSWTENRELAELFLKKQREYGGDKQYRERAGAFFSPHSQVLQAWVEGGILGAAFFAFLLYQVVRSARWTVKFRPLDSLTPLLLNFLLFGAWALLMSPFGSSRLAIATLAAIVLMLRVEGTVAQPRAAP